MILCVLPVLVLLTEHGKTAIGSTVFMSNEVDVLSLVSPFENVSPDHIQS
jgi:hypothetical protein